MNAPQEYLVKSANVRIEALGLGKFVGLPVERPDLKKLTGFYSEKKGEMEFSDVASFSNTTSEPVVVTEFHLYYGDDLVGMRKTPPIIIGPHDTMEVNWNLTITKDGGTARIGL